jgi:hypothetical protein
MSEVVPIKMLKKQILIIKEMLLSLTGNHRYRIASKNERDMSAPLKIIFFTIKIFLHNIFYFTEE